MFYWPQAKYEVTLSYQQPFQEEALGDFLKHIEAVNPNALAQISLMGLELLRQRLIPRQTKYLDGFFKLINTQWPALD
jgi:hypothetical protein